MLTSPELQESNTINPDNSIVIAALGESILPEFSHNILHEVLQDSLKISYTLHHVEENKPITISRISQALCNFLEFYVTKNFILPYYSNSAGDAPSLTQQPLHFKIRVNNTTESETILPSTILSQTSFDKITITSALKSIISSLLSNELSKHPIIGLNQQLTLSFDTIFNIPFDINTLNNNLATNLPTVKGIYKLYSIIELYNNSPTTTLIPDSQPKDLKLAVIHVKDPQNKKSNALISACITTSDPQCRTSATDFIKGLCSTQYNYLNLFTIYKIDSQAFNTLPDPQECSLTCHKQPTASSDAVTYKITCHNLTEETFCNQIHNYIFTLSTLYGTQHLALSLEFSLKKDITITHNTTLEPRFEFPDLNTHTNIKKLLCTVCNISYHPVSRAFSKKNTADIVKACLNSYDIYLHIIPSQNISQQISTVSSTSFATQDDQITTPESTQHPELITRHKLTKHTSQPSLQTTTQLQTTDLLSHPTTSRPSQIQPLTPISDDITPTTEDTSLSTTTPTLSQVQASTSGATSSTIEPDIQRQREFLPSIVQDNSYIARIQEDISALRKTIKPVKRTQIYRSTNIQHSKRNLIIAYITISTLTICSIIGVLFPLRCYVSSEMENIKSITVISIFCIAAIAFIGAMLYYHIKTPNNLVETTVSNPTDIAATRNMPGTYTS
ncbi:hypothetical protein ECHLIB_0942 [Ehrlichia chaffeensis str. Liberty]|uniref:hypothetical protein n=1 Tax=Ehrlichia chaffeensis TaxID=945 RepID=UPI000444AF16|nr:hypothetical protein [Ehrlichia chaffeensis]AHX06975.1 hypothetical protein ECHLIB_0942 [Ehrlichia chaffeensis str. Liberty]